MNILDQLQDAAKLPMGHEKIREARERVDREYSLCREKERQLMKRGMLRKKHSLKESEALELISELSRRLGEKRTPKLILNSKDVHPYAGGHYDHYGTYGREIHLPNAWIGTGVLLHEYTHFLQAENKYRGGHGEDFVMLEEMVFPLAEEILREWKKREDEWWV